MLESNEVSGMRSQNDWYYKWKLEWNASERLNEENEREDLALEAEVQQEG